MGPVRPCETCGEDVIPKSVGGKMIYTHCGVTFLSTENVSASYGYSQSTSPEQRRSAQPHVAPKILSRMLLGIVAQELQMTVDLVDTPSVKATLEEHRRQRVKEWSSFMLR